MPEQRARQPVKPRPCIALHANRSILRLYVRHIEAFFGQERHEISCKAILDSERALVPLRWFKLDVGIDEDPGCFRERHKSQDCYAWTACNAKVHLMVHCLILHSRRQSAKLRQFQGEDCAELLTS